MTKQRNFLQRPLSKKRGSETMDRGGIVLWTAAAPVATWDLAQLMNHRRRSQLLDETGGRVDEGDSRQPCG